MGISRKTRGRKIKDKILIVCEGVKTEPNYFKAFRDHCNVAVKIKGCGTAPIKLVEEAIKLKKEAKKKKEPYKQCWCVFDIDNNPAININSAINLANLNSIKYVYSNECFELWYLLHYAYHNTPIPRKKYEMILSKKLKSTYTKSYEYMYDKLFKLQSIAIKNAKKLFSSYLTNNPHANNPSTTVFELVELLNSYK